MKPLSSFRILFNSFFSIGYLADGKNYDTFTLYVKDGVFCHFLASMFSGLVTTIASMPVDIAKTR